MTERKRWPDHVEDLRLDAIALAHDGKYNLRMAETSLHEGDSVGVAKMLVATYHKLDGIQELLKRARRA